MFFDTTRNRKTLLDLPYEVMSEIFLYYLTVKEYVEYKPFYIHPTITHSLTNFVYWNMLICEPKLKDYFKLGGYSPKTKYISDVQSYYEKNLKRSLIVSFKHGLSSHAMRHRRFIEVEEGQIECYVEGKNGKFGKNLQLIHFQDIFPNITCESRSEFKLIVYSIKKTIEKTILLKDSCLYHVVGGTKSDNLILKLHYYKEGEKNPKKFPHKHFKFQNIVDFDEFKGYVIKGQGIFGGDEEKSNSSLKSLFSKKKEKTQKSNIEKIDVNKWKRGNVLEWINEIININQKEEEEGMKCKKIFKENQINGSKLLLLNEVQLIKLGVSKKRVRGIIIEELTNLKRFKTYSKGFTTVKQKLQTLEGFPKVRVNDENIIKYVYSLSNSTFCLHEILNTNTLKIHKFQQGTEEKLKKKKRDYGYFNFDEEDDVEMFNYIDKYDESRVNLKIVLYEDDWESKDFQGFLFPIIRRQDYRKVLTQRKKSGRDIKLKIGVCVGPWFIKYEHMGLVNVKRCCSSRVFALVDVNQIRIPKEVNNEITSRLSKLLVKWNIDPTQKPKGACAKFVKDVKKTLDMNDFGDNSLGKLLDEIEKNGYSSVKFVPGKEFREYFELDKEYPKEEIEFDSHVELDKFCVRIRNICLDVYNCFENEWLVLKLFDRVFWCRHIANPENEDFQPLPPKKQSLRPFHTGCPYTDPRETRGYR